MLATCARTRLRHGLHQHPEPQRGKTAENTRVAANPDHTVDERGGCGHDDILALCITQHTHTEADQAKPDCHPANQPRPRL